MKVRLIKLSKNPGGLRTPEVEGECTFLPYLGGNFFMTAPGLEVGTRVICTSTIMDVVQHKSEAAILFSTRNSEYRLELLDAP